MKILFLPADLDAAGCYRCIFPMAYLALFGHDAFTPAFILKNPKGDLVPPLLGRQGLGSIPPGQFHVGFMADQIESCDIVVVQGGMSEMQRDQAFRFRDKGSKLILDLDDDLHRVPAYNPGRKTVEGFSNKNTLELVKAADLVTVATDALAEFYGRWTDNIIVLRNYLFWPMWQNVDKGAGWKRFRVGYMGNMDFHEADLLTIAPQLRKWLERNPDVEFVAAGDPRIHDVVGTPEGQQVSTSRVFFRSLDLPQITATFDVGLVPLVRNDFNECKSWLKGLEYAACGIPCIATPTAEYRRFVTEDTGWLAKHPKDWIERLDAVTREPDVVRDMGVKARQKARDLSLDHFIHEWEQAYGRTYSMEGIETQGFAKGRSNHPIVTGEIPLAGGVQS